MDREIIMTVDAPKTLGPYSQAIKIDNFVFTAGQIGIDPFTQKMVEGGIKEQTEQVIKNLRTVLEKSGMTLDDAVKADVFLTELSNFAEMNEIYSLFFSQAEPARSTIVVKDLPKGALVEIALIAAQ